MSEYFDILYRNTEIIEVTYRCIQAVPIFEARLHHLV